MALQLIPHCYQGLVTQMNKKTQNGQKWRGYPITGGGGSYPTRRPLEPSFMRFLTGNL